MTAAWVAGSVRAGAMARRRLGGAAVRSLAESPSLAVALDRLSTTAYGHDVRPGQSLAEAQHAIGATLLWHLRVLAGWVPWQGTPVLRVLTAGFEIVNIEELLRAHDGLAAERPYDLGALSTAWSRLSLTTTRAELRDVLASSAWEEVGESDRAIQTGLRVSWAQRAATALPSDWVLGAVALLVAREHLHVGQPLVGSARRGAEALLGERPLSAPSLDILAAELPPPAAWVLAGVTDPADLWRAEVAWWRRVERDGFSLLRKGRFDPDPLLGAAAVLAVDAWRVRAALEVAARGGTDLEAFDAVA